MMEGIKFLFGLIFYLCFKTGKGQVETDELLQTRKFCVLENVNITCKCDEKIAIESLDFYFHPDCENQCCSYNITNSKDRADDNDIEMIRRECSGRQNCSLNLSGNRTFGSSGEQSPSYLITNFSCKPDCGDTTNITNGVAKLREENNTYQGSLADIRCDLGYEPDKFEIICLETGLWETASCLLIDCGNVSSILNGKYVLEDNSITTFGAVATVTCDKGYESFRNITCLDGQWSNSSCVVKDCGSVPTLSNGIYVLADNDNTTFGAEAIATCDKSYTSSSNITCLEDGQWSNSTCTAKVVDCGDTLDIIDGIAKLREENNTYQGSLADIRCDLGYEPDKFEIICLETGLWETASCLLIDCGNLSTISNGKYVLEDNSITTFGAVATVICDKGYESSSNITCLEDGQWSNYSCIVKDCGHVPTLLNGTYVLEDINNTTFGAVATVTCDKGYESNSNITCLEDGQWSNSSCIAKDCGNVPTLLNGKYVLKHKGYTTYGAMAIVTCDKGYESSSNITCSENGQWSNSSCTAKDCGNVPTIANGKYELKDKSYTTYDAVAIVTCDKGYASSSNITCSEDGQWSSSSCKIKDCGSVPSISNGKYVLKNKDKTSFGAVANVMCDKGYESSSSIKCLEDGQWSDSSCTAKDCGNVPTLLNGKYELEHKDFTTFGAVATVTCDKGYESYTNITCSEDGQWSRSICKAKDCGNPSKIVNGKYVLEDENNTTFGAVAIVVCDDGYESESNATCLEHGQWSNSVCTAKDCGNPPKVQFGSVELVHVSMSTYQSTAKLKCQEGYRSTKEEIKCEETGLWQSSTCERIIEDTAISVIIAMVITPVLICLVVVGALCFLKYKGRKYSMRTTGGKEDQRMSYTNNQFLPEDDVESQNADMILTIETEHPEEQNINDSTEFSKNEVVVQADISSTVNGPCDLGDNDKKEDLDDNGKDCNNSVSKEAEEFQETPETIEMSKKDQKEEVNGLECSNENRLGEGVALENEEEDGGKNLTSKLNEESDKVKDEQEHGSNESKIKDISDDQEDDEEGEEYVPTSDESENDCEDDGKKG